MSPSNLKGKLRKKKGGRVFHLTLTYETIPFCVQVCLVCQAASQNVVTVVVAGFQPGHAAAVWTVQHLGQGFNAPWNYIHLQNKHELVKLHPLPINRETAAEWIVSFCTNQVTGGYSAKPTFLSFI